MEEMRSALSSIVTVSDIVTQVAEDVTNIITPLRMEAITPPTVVPIQMKCCYSGIYFNFQSSLRFIDSGVRIH